MNAPAAGGGADTVRLGVAIPAQARPTAASLERTLDLCTRLRVSCVEVSIDLLEGVLGAPVPTVPLDPPPADGVAFGLLDLEEDVLRDSYDLAKRTFDAQIQAWRASASLAPLAELQRRWRNSGVAIDVVSVPALVGWADSDVDYACRVAGSVGARVLSTAVSLAGPRRLVPHTRRHDLLLSFTAEASTGPADLARILESEDPIAAAIDVGSWTRAADGSPVAFLDRHAARVSHVLVSDTRPRGAAVALGGGDGPVRDVLRAMRDRRWTFPAIVAVAPAADDARWREAVTQALADCRTNLERTT